MVHEWLRTINTAFDPNVSILVACSTISRVEDAGVWL